MCSHLTNDTEVSLERNNESSMSKELDCRSVRRVYLITYSRADLVKFPTRRSFAHAVLPRSLAYRRPSNSGVVAKKNTSRPLASIITWL